MARDPILHGILGKRGYGKTTRLIEVTEYADRLVAWDPNVSPEKPRGQFGMPDALRFTDAGECARFIRTRGNGLLRCAFHPQRWHEHEPTADDFARILDACLENREAGGRRITLALDEISTLCKRGIAADALAWCCAYGRQYLGDVPWTARKPSEVAEICYGQADVIDCFRITSRTDQDVLRTLFTAEDLKRIARLEIGEFVSTEEDDT